ncbi:MAG: hypothetical protein ACI4EV_02840, partial [Lachnospiraceae bacterium]
NKRNSSDYYHSMSATRSEMYMGRILAVMLWQTIIVAVVCVGTVLANIADVGLIIKFYVAVYIVSLQVIAAMGLAMSLTTGILYNLFFTVIILLFVRGVSEFVLFIITDINSTLVDYSLIAGIFDRKYNMLTGLTMGTVDFDYGIEKQLSEIGSYIYTVVLTAVLLVLGIVAFNKRKSEIADSGNTKLVNALAKIVISTIVFIIFIYMQCVYNGDKLPATSLILGIVSVILVTLLWDLLTNKKIRIKSSIVAVVFSAVLFVVISVGSSAIANYKPDVNSVDYIEINSGSYIAQKQYYGRVFNNLKIEDKNTISYFCNNYDLIKGDSRHDDFGEIHLEVTYVDGIRKNTVKVSVPQNDDFLKVVKADKVISDRFYTDMPDFSEINMDAMGCDTEEEIESFRQIYEACRKDIVNTRPGEFIDVNLGKPIGSCFWVHTGDGLEITGIPIIESMHESYETYYNNYNKMSYNTELAQKVRSDYESMEFQAFFEKYNHKLEIRASAGNVAGYYNAVSMAEDENGKEFLKAVFSKFLNNETVKSNAEGDIVILVLSDGKDLVRYAVKISKYKLE